MVQAQKGYFQENGQFIPESLLVKIPVNKKVTIIWKEDPAEKRISAAQREIAQNVLMAMQKIRKELTAEDIAALNELESGKYKPDFENRSSEL